jgi:tetratricopeptide (TPR) repeat protein
MSDPGKAVFLSYASQDAVAAKRIADALRAAGVEVWFDQNELVGGDAWDQKIRRQIRDCALLIPVISKTTQGRREAYFRLEWKLAEERTHLMAKGTTFLLPVTIDETDDRSALVPDAFLAVQWTKAPGGEVPPAFAVRVGKLLEGGMEAGRPRPDLQGEGTLPPRGPRVGRWLALGAVAVVVLALIIGQPWRRTTIAEKPAASAAVLKNPASGDKMPAPVANTLVPEGRAMLEKFTTDDTQREALSLAEELAKRAVQENVTDADAWSLSAQVSSSFYISGRDRLPARQAAVNAAAERAMQLAPKSDEALFARAVAYRLETTTSAEAERLLRELVQRNPGDRRMLRMLGNVLRNRDATEEALAVYRQAAALPGGDARAELACAEMLEKLGRELEAAAAADRSLAVQPTGAAYLYKVNLARVSGDLAQARAELAKVPPAVLLDVRGASLAANVWLWSHEPEKVIAVLNAIPGDDLYNHYFFGPKSLLLGFAHHMAGRNEVAKMQWRLALRNLEQRAENDPMLAMEPLFMGVRMFLGFLTDDPAKKAEAMQMLGLYLQLGPAMKVDPMWDPAKLFTLLGMQDTMIDFCEEVLRRGGTPGLRERLRTSPEYDPLRGNPRFEALLKEPEGEQKTEDGGRRTSKP